MLLSFSAHCDGELRPKPDLSRTKLCPDLNKGGSCTKGGACRFAHQFEDLRATNAFYKTKLCKWWFKGDCPSGVTCRHAHGQQELREPNPGEALLTDSDDDDDFDSIDMDPSSDLQRQPAASPREATPQPIQRQKPSNGFQSAKKDVSDDEKATMTPPSNRGASASPHSPGTARGTEQQRSYQAYKSSRGTHTYESPPRRTIDSHPRKVFSSEFQRNPCETPPSKSSIKEQGIRGSFSDRPNLTNEFRQDGFFSPGRDGPHHPPYQYQRAFVMHPYQPLLCTPVYRGPEPYMGAMRSTLYERTVPGNGPPHRNETEKTQQLDKPRRPKAKPTCETRADSGGEEPRKREANWQPTHLTSGSGEYPKCSHGEEEHSPRGVSMTSRSEPPKGRFGRDARDEQESTDTVPSSAQLSHRDNRENRSERECYEEAAWAHNPHKMPLCHFHYQPIRNPSMQQMPHCYIDQSSGLNTGRSTGPWNAVNGSRAMKQAGGQWEGHPAMGHPPLPHYPHGSYMGSSREEPHSRVHYPGGGPHPPQPSHPPHESPKQHPPHSGVTKTASPFPSPRIMMSDSPTQSLESSGDSSALMSGNASRSASGELFLPIPTKLSGGDKGVSRGEVPNEQTRSGGDSGSNTTFSMPHSLGEVHPSSHDLREKPKVKTWSPPPPLSSRFAKPDSPDDSEVNNQTNALPVGSMKDGGDDEEVIGEVESKLFNDGLSEMKPKLELHDQDLRSSGNPDHKVGSSKRVESPNQLEERLPLFGWESLYQRKRSQSLHFGDGGDTPRLRSPAGDVLAAIPHYLSSDTETPSSRQLNRQLNSQLRRQTAGGDRRGRFGERLLFPLGDGIGASQSPTARHRNVFGTPAASHFVYDNWIEQANQVPAPSMSVEAGAECESESHARDLSFGLPLHRSNGEDDGGGLFNVPDLVGARNITGQGVVDGAREDDLAWRTFNGEVSPNSKLTKGLEFVSLAFQSQSPRSSAQSFLIDGLRQAGEEASTNESLHKRGGEPRLCKPKAIMKRDTFPTTSEEGEGGSSDIGKRFERRKLDDAVVTNVPCPSAVGVAFNGSFLGNGQPPQQPPHSSTTFRPTDRVMPHAHGVVRCRASENERTQMNASSTRRPFKPCPGRTVGSLHP
eukprot:GHVN01020439.1.p1 GENE.GHVN01020439.1~~GHVN01020439.1.p1  ORF type:complete len:1128 (-),score=164.11 GHVN01020439.1:348-3731(-)